MALTHVTCTCFETCFAYRDALGVRVPQIVSYFNDSSFAPEYSFVVCSVYSAALQTWSSVSLFCMFHRIYLQYRGCVLIRECLVRCVSRPLWSPRSLISFVPWKPGDTVTASGRKELSVVKMAANTCFNQPSRLLRRIEERQLVGLTGNAMVTVSTAAPMDSQRLATTGHKKSYLFA